MHVVVFVSEDEKDARTLNPVAQEIELLLAELAYGQINGEARNFQMSEHLMQVPKTFVSGLTGDENVVRVDECEV